MPNIPVPLGPYSDKARGKPQGDAALVNCFVEASEQGKEKYAIYGDMGLASFATGFSSAAALRGNFNLDSNLYVVADERLFKVDANGNETLIGDVVGQKTVIPAINDKSTAQVVIVSDNDVYYIESDVLTEITDADLPANVHSATFLDGYIIFGIRDGRFFISALNDASSIDALDFAEAEGSRDHGIRVITIRRELWYFNAETTEVFVNTGADFPFERLDGGFLPVGCASKYTPAAFDNTVVWVTNKAYVARAEGYQAQRISTHAVEIDIQRAIDNQRADELQAFVYTEGGHEFYQLTGPDFTWVYDAATKLWHPKESYGRTKSKMLGYCRCFDKHFVGDDSSATLYQMNFDTHEEGDDALITTIRTPVMHMGAARVEWNAFYLDMELGVGSATVNPNIMFNWSDDGGKTYSTEIEAPLGLAGEYEGRVEFHCLGQSYRQGRIFQIRCSAAVKRVFLGASADVEVLEP